MHIILSYPKSGRTWLRFMVDSYLCRVFDLNCSNVFEAENQLKKVHPIEWTHLSGAMIDCLPYWAMGGWRLGESMQRVPWLILTRNFQSTLTSAYFQARDRIKVFRGTPSDFLRDPRFGIIKLVTFYNILEYIRPDIARCDVFAYEELLENPKTVFTRVIESLDLRVDENLLEQVVEDAGFENMKRLSITPEYAGTVIAPIDPNDPQTFKVRSAGREKKSLFAEYDLEYMHRVIDDLFLHKHKPEYRYCLGKPQKSPTLKPKITLPRVQESTAV